MDFGFIEFLILVAVFYLLSVVVKLDGRLKVMKHTLDQISKHAGISLEGPIDDELRELIQDGYDVKAVKRARETMGLSLLEGKQYIDRLKLEDETESGSKYVD